MQDRAQASPPSHAPASNVRSAVFYPRLTCDARRPFCSARVHTPDGVVATSDCLKGDTRRGIPSAPSERGATTPLTGTGAEIVARLAALAPPEKQPRVAFLGRCEALLVEPLFVLFSARMPVRGERVDAWIVLHDDRFASAAAMQKLLDA